MAIVLALAIAVCHAPATPPLPAGVVADDRLDDHLRGVVAGPVVTTARGTGAALEVGDAVVWIWTPTILVPGTQIAAIGRVRTSRGFIGPAMPDRRALADRYEMSATAIVPLGDAPGARARVWRWAAATQARWSRRIEIAGGPPAARAALRGIVTGDRGDIPGTLDDRWRATGIYHVLSVSGLHLAVIAGLAFALLRRLVAASPWGGRVRPARWAAPPALALALAYTLVTGAQLATVRALIVIALVLAAAMLDRPVRLVDALGAAAIAILAWRPADLFDPSFQLSFTAALALAVRPSSDRRGVRGYLARGLASSAWVTIATAPITAYHFHQVTPGGIVGNLVLAPLLELAALPLALVGVALGELGEPLVRAATWLVARVDQLAELFALGAPVGRIALTSALSVALLVVLALALAARRRRTRRDAAAWIAMCLVWALGRTPPPPGALRVTFLDVGQGDAALVELPDGAVWLIDAGGRPNARDAAAASAPGIAIARALTAFGHDRIDVAIVSHPHPDHYLGLGALAVPIGELWTAAEIEPGGTRGGAGSFTHLAHQLAGRGTRLVHPRLGAARAQAGVTLHVWGPRHERLAVAAADPVRTVNDNSLVVELRYRGRSILFTGDLEEEGEALLVAAGVPRVDVVKVPHHGSPTSSSAALIAATHPALAVISCGRANAFGFPSAAVVDRWRRAGAEVARTDEDGAITVIIDPAGRLAVDRSVVQSGRGDPGARPRSLRRGRRPRQRAAQDGQPRGGPALVPQRAGARSGQHPRARPARPDVLPRQPVRGGAPDLRAAGREGADRCLAPPEPRPGVPQAQRVGEGDPRPRGEPRARPEPGPRRQLPRARVRARRPLRRGVPVVPARRAERARERDRDQPHRRRARRHPPAARTDAAGPAPRARRGARGRAHRHAPLLAGRRAHPDAGAAAQAAERPTGARAHRVAGGPGGQGRRRGVHRPALAPGDRDRAVARPAGGADGPGTLGRERRRSSPRRARRAAAHLGVDAVRAPQGRRRSAGRRGLDDLAGRRGGCAHEHRERRGAHARGQPAATPAVRARHRRPDPPRGRGRSLRDHERRRADHPRRGPRPDPARGRPRHRRRSGVRAGHAPLARAPDRGAVRPRRDAAARRLGARLRDRAPGPRGRPAPRAHVRRGQPRRRHPLPPRGSGVRVRGVAAVGERQRPRPARQATRRAVPRGRRARDPHDAPARAREARRAGGRVHRRRAPRRLDRPRDPARRRPAERRPPRHDLHRVHRRGHRARRARAPRAARRRGRLGPRPRRPREAADATAAAARARAPRRAGADRSRARHELGHRGLRGRGRRPAGRRRQARRVVTATPRPGPLEGAARLATLRGRVLLHSGRDDDGLGRWSFVAAEPRATLIGRGRSLVELDRDGRPARRFTADPFEAIEAFLAAHGCTLDAAADGAPPAPRVIGYLGYDLARVVERLPGGSATGQGCPDLWLGAYDAVARWGPGAGATVADAEILGPDPDARARLAARLAAPAPPALPPRFGPLTPDDDGDHHIARVEKIRDYLASGDVYQVNLARRLVARVTAPGDPLRLYEALAAVAPAPYGALLEADGVTVLSGSPERFLASVGDRIETRPIKGTHPRTPTGADALARSAKDAAEHLMIVDLERNDLGRIADTGSVTVDALGYVVELPALFHMVSRVSARPRPGTGYAALLRATFPGGSITGAPKVRAMELIDELEPARRGPYCGALGYFGAGGAFDLAIAIRIGVLADGELRIHVGGGIVADSDPGAELEETATKATGWVAALDRLASGCP